MKVQLKIYIVLLFIMLIVGCAAPIKNGFVQESDGYTYYYVDGEMQTGWQEIGDDVYYFYSYYMDPGEKPYGAMLIDDLVQLDSYKGEGKNYYLFSKEGKMFKNGFDGSRYFDKYGAMLKDVEMDIEGKKYSFDSNGYSMIIPHYSFPALGRGNYDFYFKQNYPLTLKNRDQTYIIAERPTVEVYGGNNNSAFISGVISLRAKDNESHVAWINCRLSTTDADGITSSAEEAIKFSSIKNGEKTRFTVTFKNTLPLNGIKINISFES